jgi:hypothetical protein
MFPEADSPMKITTDKKSWQNTALTALVALIAVYFLYVVFSNSWLLFTGKPLISH